MEAQQSEIHRKRCRRENIAGQIGPDATYDKRHHGRNRSEVSTMSFVMLIK
jgi:hypothetical protein